MLIEYVKLVGHIPFKSDTIELVIDDSDTILIKGRTGSGKSFLVNSLHPLSSSSRYVKSYSIYPGKRGYKEIIYKLPDRKIRIRHEYVPNNKGGHSCKSYIDELVNGGWREMNPSGLNNEFEELVKKHLNYEKRTAEFASLNVKSSGFIQSTSENRNKILFSLVENDTMKTMKENLSKNISFNNARLKMFKESRENIILYRNIEEDKTTVKNYERMVVELTSDVKNINEELHMKISELASFKSESSKFDISELKGYRDYLVSISDLCVKHKLNTVGSVLSFIRDKTNKIKELEINIRELESNERDIKSKIAKVERINELAASMNKIRNDIETIERDISKKFNLSKLTNIYQLESHMSNISDRTDSIKMLDLASVRSLDDLRVYRQNESDSKEELIKRKSAYEQAIEFKRLIKSEEDTICKSCGNHIDVLRKIYDAININENYDELQSKIELKNRIINTIDNSVKSIKDSIKYINESNMLTPEFLNELKVSSLDEYIKYILSNDNIEDIDDKFNNVRDYGLNQLSSLRKSLEEYEYQYKSLNSDETFCITTLESSLESNRNKLNESKSKLDDIVNNDIPRPSIPLDNISNYAIDDIIGIYDNSRDIERTINGYESEILRLKKGIVDTEEIIEEKKSEIVKLNKIIEEYESTNYYVKLYSDEKKNMDITKSILFQDIPSLLLEENINYIESCVNKILSQSNIDMTVSFKFNDTKTGIEIPVFISNKNIPDASQLSSGETSLISTLINSTLLSLLGYKILIVDELDAYLDTNFRVVYEKILSSMCTVLDISQVWCISHNINLDGASMLITIGNTDGLDIDYVNKKVINLN